HDELDPAQHRRALLALADDLGTRLRADGQITTSLTCTVRYADQTSTRRSRPLPEATHHTVLLARAEPPRTRCTTPPVCNAPECGTSSCGPTP
ncbi:DinB/UmuC family translesion DNA polymerase, partial [Streptomyces sp. NPDC000878]